MTPQELETMLADSGCETRFVRGLMYWPFLNCWQRWPFTSVNYAVHAVRVGGQTPVKRVGQQKGLGAVSLFLVTGVALASVIVWRFLSEKTV